MSWKVPAGSNSDFTIALATASVRKLVTVAGFTMLGTPARKEVANFSSIPHTGKLKALIWTATPSIGTQICRPINVPPLLNASGPPST